MRKLLALLLLISPLVATAGDENKGPIQCSANAPYKYRIAFTYYGGRKSQSEVGSTAGFYCLEREIKSEADWDWLQRKIETNPKISRITIMSVVPVVN
ncbi:hypothetical protein [Ralstonia pseudosolanacearum]|uniref:hypothetical protein n=1 Tax=Ralstonia pseudosolanacearum TaxID=1310165 RepID=UPI003CEA74C7